MNNSKLRVALLLGGTSPEREVSKSSGASVYAALLKLGYDVVPIDPAFGTDQPDDPQKLFADKDYSKTSNRNIIECVNSELFDEIDLAFLALHGRWGEDGTIQSLLEMRGIKYTGSKVLSSSISMDKVMSKILFQHYGVNTPKWIAMEKNNIDPEAIVKLIEKDLGFPCVIKPNDQGSTVGLTICHKKDQVEEAVKLASDFSEKVLIEEYIGGREMTVAMVENKALPVLEIKPKHELYDYECKYTKGMSEYIVPAEISKSAFNEMQSQALLAFTSLNCSGYARVDFRLSEVNKPYCLEVNTLPGMTSTSLVPKMAKAVGISFEDLVDRIIKISL